MTRRTVRFAALTSGDLQTSSRYFATPSTSQVVVRCVRDGILELVSSAVFDCVSEHATRSANCNGSTIYENPTLSRNSNHRHGDVMVWEIDDSKHSKQNFMYVILISHHH